MTNDAEDRLRRLQLLRIKGKHGGRRPGAGAPFGNRNALRSGQYSPRYSAASLLIGILNQLYPQAMAALRAGKTPDQLPYFLAAARDVVEGWPDLSDQIATYLSRRIVTAASQGEEIVPHQLTLFRLLSRLPPRRRFDTVMNVLLFVAHHNPALADAAATRLLALFTASLDAIYHPPTPDEPAPTPQSNNQTIKSDEPSAISLKP